MAGLRGVCALLEKHRDVICDDLKVDEVVPELVSKGIISVEEEKALVNENETKAKAELLITQLGRKGFAAFQEFCHVLEKSHPHLLTCFLMDIAAMGASTTPAPSSQSGGDTESSKSLDLALRERDRVVQELNELRGTLTKRKVNKRDMNVNSAGSSGSGSVSGGAERDSEPPEPGGGAPPSYRELMAAGSSTAGSELSDDRLTEVLEEPVTEELGGERVVWEYHHVSLNRVPGYGFGIAVSGGRDNPHFTTGDPSIAISDVLKSGPAEGKLRVNDRVLSANGVSLENVDYATAVQVLKDSGAVVRLYIKRRVVLPAHPEPQHLKLSLTKARKKDDFGVILGCQIYVKEILHRPAATDRDGGALEVGDVVLRINQLPTEGMSLKEARKMMDAAKERVHLLVRRDPVSPTSFANGHSKGKDSPSHYHTRESSMYSNYGNQNLYVQPPTRQERADFRAQSMPPPPRLYDDKNNLVRQTGRTRGPLTEAALDQLDHMPHPTLDEAAPPRPPLPRDTVDRPSMTNGTSGVNGVSAINGGGMVNGVNGHHPPHPPSSHSDIYDSRRQPNYTQHSPKARVSIPDPRFVSFQKEGSVGIRLTGGNETGIFVTAVQAGSPAAVQGLQPGDKIIKVNGMEMKGVTREEAVLFLLSLQDQIDLIVQHRSDEYDQIMTSQRGDSFYIRTHFNHEQTTKNELSFRNGDLFHVVDTLNMGVVGAWQVFRIGRNNEETQKGVIPNKSRAEELATAQFNAAKKEHTNTESRSRFFSRKRRQRRSKSLGKDHWEDVVFSDSVSKFPAYERVALRGCGFVRPVVLFGAVADLTRQQLLSEMPDRFCAPQLDMSDESKTKSSGIIRLSSIRELVSSGKHALLDVTPNAVDRLNFAQLYPICIFLRAESKHIIKEVRTARAPDRPQSKSNKKLFEQCQKLEKLWSHLFTATITMTDADGWYRRVKELIEKQQNAPIWMSESKPGESLSDDYLFPMTSRLSYASSPESDMEGTEGGASPARSPPHSPSSADSRLVRSSSDPSIAPDDLPPPLADQTGPPPYSPYKQDDTAPRSATGKRGSHGGDSRYGFSRFSSEEYPPLSPGPGAEGRRPPAASPPASPRSPYQTLPHDFRTNGDVGNSAPPPQVDRGSKPLSPPAGTRSYGRASGGQLRSYLDGADAAYIHSASKNFTLDRIRTNNYDSSSSYESYNRFSNMHDDLKARSLPPRDLLEPPLSPGHAATGRGHDPYRFTRSTAQPIQSPGAEPPMRPPHSGGARSSDYKPLPPPKSGVPGYKPVPPPKPKSYRNGGGGGGGDTLRRGGSSSVPESPLRKTPDSRGSREDFGGFPGDDSGGFDSGHGSSLDRNYELGRTYMNVQTAAAAAAAAAGGHGYYPVSGGGQPPPPPPPADSAGLDLSNREQRGSAFELYKKPLEPRYGHYTAAEHGAR